MHIKILHENSTNCLRDTGFVVIWARHFLSYSKTLSIGLALVIKPATSTGSAVKHSTHWATPAVVQRQFFILSEFDSVLSEFNWVQKQWEFNAIRINHILHCGQRSVNFVL